MKVVADEDRKRYHERIPVLWPEGTTIEFEHGVTALVGGNGAGNTALLQALSAPLRLDQDFRPTPTEVGFDFHPCVSFA